MKTWIIEETFSTTHFHKVQAETYEEAKDKFYNDEDVEYDVKEEYYGNDASIEIFEEERWPF